MAEAGARLGVGVLVSGRGTNLQAIIDAVETGRLPIEVRLVLSNRADAPALDRARRHGAPTSVVRRGDHLDRLSQQREMARLLRLAGVGLVVLAGFSAIVGPGLLDAYPGAIINIHPSLLPAFPGSLHAQRDALEHGVKVAGCTVHFVTEEIDAGPIILQACVPVEEMDTVETLADRILKEEHRILPEAIRLFAERRLSIEGRRVRPRQGASRRLPAGQDTALEER